VDVPAKLDLRKAMLPCSTSSPTQIRGDEALDCGVKRSGRDEALFIRGHSGKAAPE